MSTPEISSSLIIVGSGPAAYTAGVYAARAQVAPLLLEGDKPGGQLMGTSLVENWPGNLSIWGPELMQQMKQHAVHTGVTIRAETVRRVDFSSSLRLWTDTHMYTARAVIIATGATPKKLGCPGEAEWWGKGVSSCAVCDAAFYKDLPVVVVGGGDSAAEHVLFLAKFTQNITLVHIRAQLSASPIMQERLKALPFLRYRFESTVVAITGGATATGATGVTRVTIAHQSTGVREELAVRGVFIAIGLLPNSGVFKEYVSCDARGFITCIEHTQTSVAGVFAAGDVVDARYRQAITAAGEGCQAALDAVWYLQQKGIE